MPHIKAQRKEKRKGCLKIILTARRQLTVIPGFIPW